MPDPDALSLLGYDHVELFVGNAKQAAYFYHKVFGFKPLAKAGLETGVRDRASYVMQQGSIRIVLSSALGPDHEIARHCALHGDGVKAIALEVADVERTMREVKARGATVLQPATAIENEQGVFKTGAVHYTGDIVFRFVQRKEFHGTFAPGFQPIDAHTCEPIGLSAIDHVVTNTYLGEMDVCADWYRRVLGFSQLAHFTDEDISTEYSALMSKVMQDRTGACKFPINEPAEGRRKSQIDEYLDFYHGPGIQHVAMSTPDICQAVRMLRTRDIDFLRVPDAYYDDLEDRVGKIDEDISELRELGILVDRDDDGYLLQVFTQPVQDRPTLFFEVIERHGSRGFGVGNFKALFVSLEREQDRRGNLA